MKKHFPRKLSIVWLQGESEIPKQSFKDNITKWKSLNPDWKVEVIDDSGLRHACKMYSDECLNVYDSMDLLHLKVDFGRYVFMYNTSSMYVDMDMYPVKPIESNVLVRNLIGSYESGESEHVLGLSVLNLDLVESFIYNGTTKLVNNAVMLCSNHNPVIKNLIDTIIKNFNRKEKYNSTFDKIQKLTGPTFFNKFFNDINFKDIFLFPCETFEPAPASGSYVLSSQTVAVHIMEMSWVPIHMQYLVKFYYYIKPMLILFIICYIVKMIIDYIMKKSDG